MFTIDLENRQVIIVNTSKKRSAEDIIIKEFDKIERKFLPGTAEKYETELVLLEIDINDGEGNPTGEKETKAFARRTDNHDWILEFVVEEFII